MPNLPGLDAGDVKPGIGFQATEIGVESEAAAARRGGMFYNQAAGDVERLGQTIAATRRSEGIAVREAADAYNKFETHREVSAGAASFADMQDTLIQQWNATAKNADPNDPSVAANFRENVLKPTLDKWTGQFSTDSAQQWALNHAEALRQHMFQKTSADMSSMAADAARVNMATVANKLSNTVMNDPSSLDHALDMADSTIDGYVSSSPTLSATDSARAKTELKLKTNEQIVKSAAFGAIQKTGQVPAWTTDPKYSQYISGPELKQFAQAAKYYDNLNKSAARDARVQQDYENKKEFNTQINQLEASTFPQNVGDQPQLPKNYWDRLRELSNHPGAQLETGKLAEMANKGNAITTRLGKPEPLGPVSHAATMELMGRMRATDNSRLTSDQPIYDAYTKGDLNNQDFNFLTAEFRNSRTPEGVAMDRSRKDFFTRYAPSIDGGMEFGEHSALGQQKMYEAEMDARRQEAEVRSKGGDPQSVYDPRSPNFFGKPDNLQRYSVSMQQAQKYSKAVEQGRQEQSQPAQQQRSQRPSWVPTDARLAPDGAWYVERNGRYSRVNPPQVQMSQ